MSSLPRCYLSGSRLAVLGFDHARLPSRATSRRSSPKTYTSESPQGQDSPRQRANTSNSQAPQILNWRDAHLNPPLFPLGLEALCAGLNCGIPSRCPSGNRLVSSPLHLPPWGFLSAPPLNSQPWSNPPSRQGHLRIYPSSSLDVEFP